MINVQTLSAINSSFNHDLFDDSSGPVAYSGPGFTLITSLGQKQGYSNTKNSYSITNQNPADGSTVYTIPPDSNLPSVGYIVSGSGSNVVIWQGDLNNLNSAYQNKSSNASQNLSDNNAAQIAQNQKDFNSMHNDILNLFGASGTKNYQGSIQGQASSKVGG